MAPTFQYELGPADMEAFFVHHAAQAPYLAARNRRMRWIWGVAFALLALVYASRSPHTSIALLAFALAYLPFYGRLNRWWYIRHQRRLFAGPDAPRLGAMTLELADGQLLVAEPEGSARLELSAIKRIDESASHYFLYVGPAAAIVVPRRPDGADGFVQALREAGA